MKVTFWITILVFVAVMNLANGQPNCVDAKPAACKKILASGMCHTMKYEYKATTCKKSCNNCREKTTSTTTTTTTTTTTSSTTTTTTTTTTGETTTLPGDENRIDDNVKPASRPHTPLRTKFKGPPSLSGKSMKKRNGKKSAKKSGGSDGLGSIPSGVLSEFSKLKPQYVRDMMTLLKKYGYI